jgi:hypothetical protein
MTSMKKRFIIGTVIVTATILHTVVNPLRAASGLRDAIEAQDGPTITKYVDFEALRSNVRTGLDESAAASQDPAAFLGASMIWAFLSPMLRAEEVQKIGQTGAGGDLMSMVDMSRAETGFGFGASSFTLTINQPGEPPVGVIFAPRGLGWKVVDLDLQDLL